MTYKEKIKQSFPFPKFRPNQLEVMNSIMTGFETYDNVILEAPTGAGKSVIAYTIAQLIGKSFIFTSQKLLQDQYIKEFPQMAILKGKGNYHCVEAERESGYIIRSLKEKIKNVVTDGEADELKNQVNELESREYTCNDCVKTKKKCEDCPYKEAVDNFIATRLGITNYHIGMLHPKIKKDAHPDLCIYDEAHSVEDIFLDFVMVSLKDQTLKRLGLPLLRDKAEEQEAKDHIETLSQETSRRIGELYGIIKLSERQAKELRQLEDISRRIAYYYEYQQCRWVWCFKEKSFKPLYIKDFTEEVLFRLSKKRLFMSATILDKDAYVSSLGLNPDNTLFLRLPSSFPIENREIKKGLATCNMGYKYIDETLPQVAMYVKMILAQHAGEKGIIHTNSYKISKYICENVIDSRLLQVTNEKKADILKHHEETEDATVLVSPSLKEGVDLKDDLSRFQIICKIPFPYLGDAQIKERQTVDNRWYNWRTCLDLVQSYGRSVRSEKDYAITYILDKNFGWFVDRNRNLLPSWFLEAIS